MSALITKLHYLCYTTFNAHKVKHHYAIQVLLLLLTINIWRNFAELLENMLSHPKEFQLMSQYKPIQYNTEYLI